MDNGDITTVYYAPHLAQQNQGERLTAEQALRSLRQVFETGVRPFTKNRLFVEQFNVVFNTPGCESHARQADAELGPFMDLAADYMGKAMFGYGLWGYKDYYQGDAPLHRRHHPRG